MDKGDKLILFKRAKRRLQKYKRNSKNHSIGIKRAIQDIRFGEEKKERFGRGR